MTDKNHVEFIQNLKKVFNQESIMVEIDSPAISFEQYLYFKHIENDLYNQKQ